MDKFERLIQHRVTLLGMLDHDCSKVVDKCVHL